MSLRGIAYLLLASIAVVLLAFFAAAGPASAHGGTVSIDDDFGPYHIVVVSSAALANKELLLTVVLTDKRAGSDDPRPVVGAQVTATLTLTGSDATVLNVPIPQEPNLGPQGYYETRLTLPSEGDWLVKITAAGPQGHESAAFPVSLHFSSVWGALVLWFVVALGAGGAGHGLYVHAA